MSSSSKPGSLTKSIMKTIFKLLFIFILSTILFSCNKDDISGAHQCGANESDRIGAVCNDGTTSTATGSGACSSHSGVKYWLCK